MKSNELKEKISIENMILEILYIGNLKSLPNGGQVMTVRVKDKYSECNLDCFKENIRIIQDLKIGDIIELKNGWSKHYCDHGKFKGWDISTGARGSISIKFTKEAFELMKEMTGAL